MKKLSAIEPELQKICPALWMPMINTADVVADRYKVSREYQDEYSLQSQQRTAAAQTEGKFNDEMGSKIPGAQNNPNYKATGISIVLHPLSPKIPSMHFNTRFLQTEKEWFGGGMDVTPCLPFEDE